MELVVGTRTNVRLKKKIQKKKKNQDIGLRRRIKKKNKPTDRPSVSDRPTVYNFTVQKTEKKIILTIEKHFGRHILFKNAFL